jgi:thiosulfate reductase cytochrome b subunit
MTVHPLPWVVRITHWVNVVAIAIMVASGLHIYNAAPFFAFRAPEVITLGSWLGAAVAWHLATMWLLTSNALLYGSYGLFAGHFRRSLLPISLSELRHEIGRLLKGHFRHDVTTGYTALQRSAYLFVLAAGALMILSGLALWKPVQFQGLAGLFGGYEGARRVHFVGMVAIILFITVHLAMVVILPATLRRMLFLPRRRAQQ